MNQHTAICMAASLIWAANAFAARAECPTSEGARVSVEVTAGPVATAFDTSLPELERLAQTAGREAHMPLRAVYSSSVLFTSEIDSRVEQGEGGAYWSLLLWLSQFGSASQSVGGRSTQRASCATRPVYGLLPRTTLRHMLASKKNG